MIIAAIALAAAAPSSAPSPKVDDEELFCVYNYMTDAELKSAASDMLKPTLREAATGAALAARGAAETCATKYKWTMGQRNSASLLAGTAHALELMHEQTKARYKDEKLGALFDALSPADQRTLLFDAPPVSEADHLAAYKRFDAAAAKAGVAKDDYPLVGQFLSVYARSLQAQAIFLKATEMKPK